jgi:DNA (cytosine-5)-methyltransferase 1
VGSLFSGIGGIDLGLERAGMRVVWQVECDPYARAVLRKHWPTTALYDDVRSVGAANLAPVDLVCGGFPCQDISNAGKRVGINGERSGLWSEYARIIRELRPRYVLVENVAALLARGLERVVGDLAACGYDAEWDCFPAAAFGAPHQRDRLFVVAHAHGDRHAGRDRTEGNEGAALGQPRALRERDAVADAARDGRQQGRKTARAGSGLAGNGSDPLAHADLARLEVSGSASEPGRADRGGQDAAALGNGDDVADTALVFRDGCDDHGRSRKHSRRAIQDVSEPRNRTRFVRSGCDWWDVEPDVGRVAHGVPSRVDRLRCLGNAVVPQVAEWIGRQILAHAEEAVIPSKQLPLSGPDSDPEEAA